ncbi:MULTISPECIES: energy transducer TonB [unclassified Agarivorans]|uniref:energy transducer TonB n=1 Tax=unclassified Agarivorans TaxID=2636026 RepID=UPI0026E47003|nr:MULTISPECIES: energy transducer TonB [unclassified Agarivorans]MDO6685316.1 energy transducer TonB [Agarivorans sp. 3_MG-2023]MDO6715512.1 energy transducer TonB [Agarivorans sp. 2_MG-2023]
MWRILLALPTGTVLAASLFILLAEVSGFNQASPPSAPNISNLQLFSLRQTSEPQHRQRLLPEPPPLLAPQDLQTPLDAGASQSDNNIIDTSSTPSISKLLQPSLTPLSLSLPHIITDTSSSGTSVSSAGLGQGPQLELSIQASYRHRPEYPMSAQRRGIEGEVELEFTVDQHGNVVANSIKVIHAEPQGFFEQAAIRTIAQWRFPVKAQSNNPGFVSRQIIEFKLKQ